MKIYPSDLSDLGWEKIEPLFKVDYTKGGRPPKYNKRKKERKEKKEKTYNVLLGKTERKKERRKQTQKILVYV